MVAVAIVVSLILSSISKPCEGPAWSWVAAGCLHQRGCHGPLRTCCMTGSRSPRLSLRLSWAASGHVFPWGVWSRPPLTWCTTRGSTACCTASHDSTRQITSHYLEPVEYITLLGRPKKPSYNQRLGAEVACSAEHVETNKLFIYKANLSIHLQSRTVLDLSPSASA